LFIQPEAHLIGTITTNIVPDDIARCFCLLAKSHEAINQQEMRIKYSASNLLYVLYLPQQNTCFLIGQIRPAGWSPQGPVFIPQPGAP